VGHKLDKLLVEFQFSPVVMFNRNISSELTFKSWFATHFTMYNDYELTFGILRQYEMGDMEERLCSFVATELECARALMAQVDILKSQYSSHST